MRTLTTTYWLLVLLAVLPFSRSAMAQCDTNQIPNFISVSEDNSDTIPSSAIRPGVGYELHSDSGHAMYRVGDVMLNGSQIWLHGWCAGKTIRDLDVAGLTDSTRTESFVVQAGDTLTFFREFAWYNPWTMTQSPTEFYSPDTIDYVIELVKASSGVRRALLDSIGVLRRVPMGVPIIYGSSPIMTVVQYVVPAPLDNETVFMRMRLQTRGTGTYRPVRTDRWGYALSDRLNDATWIAYMTYLESVLPKMVRTAEKGSAVLEASPNPSNGRINLTFDATTSTAVTVAVYDASGLLLFIPYYSPQGSGNISKAELHIDQPGTYFVALLQDRTLVNSTTVIIH